MPLKKGMRLGPYEVIDPIGAGGMGEVYRALDTRLDRTVAVKVLPEEAASSPERRQRLDREARAISKLSHPNICALYDVGHQDGTDYLVMEHIEGETLEDRMGRKGALPMGQVLEVATQIAAALDAAHRLGMTHRDLKPGNVMLTATGAKLLDFGLAKLDPSREAGPLLDTTAPTEAKPLTAEGSIMGTLLYMAPEQLEGREADSRSDIWALGLLIHEMATGERVFQGRSKASLIASIMEKDPPALGNIRPDTPPPLGRLVQRCLAKDPEERWQSARDLQAELQWIRESGAELASPTKSHHRSARERMLWAALAILLSAALGWALVISRRDLPVEVGTARFSLDLPAQASEESLRVSPDGKLLSFLAHSDGRPHLWLRPLDSAEARPLPATEGATNQFWSPDSRHIGFMAGGKLKTMDITGGRPQDLAEGLGPGPFQMASWSVDGTILYNISESTQDGLYSVPAEGGSSRRLRVLNEKGEEVDVVFPNFLPDGRHFLFVGEGPSRSGIWVADLMTLKATHLADANSYVQYAPPGVLLYVRGGALVAHPFDADHLRFRGPPVRIAEQVQTHADYGVPNFSASRGVLTYYTGLDKSSRLVWRDRNGLELAQVGKPEWYGSLRLSPEGRRLLVSIGDLDRDERDLWLIELARDVPTRITRGAVDVFGPVWSPDGLRAIFSLPVDAPPSLHLMTLSGGEPEQLLPRTSMMQWPSDWSKDGGLIIYSSRNPNTFWDLWTLPIDGSRDPAPFLLTQYNEFDGQFSPDGEHVAFISDESGDYEVYVMPFNGQGGKRRISTTGGLMPRWRGDGRELFYLADDNRIMAVPVTLKGGFEPGVPQALFAIEPGDSNLTAYDVTADGQRFLINAAIPGNKPAPTVVLNWTAELPDDFARD